MEVFLMKKFILFSLLILSIVSLSALEVAEYGVPNEPWSEYLGNHRAVVEVNEAGAVFGLTIPWRLKFSPAMKKLIVIEASTGEEIVKIRRKSVNALSGEVFFKANSSGIYYIYYLPYQPDPTWAGFKGRYSPRNANTFLPLRSKVKPAVLKKIESRTTLDSFYPMEVCPTVSEKRDLISQNKDNDYLVFVENRLNQIRMKRELPYKWTQSGEVSLLQDDAAQNEWYPVQVGLFAAYKDISNVQCSYSDLVSVSGALIPAEAFSCINIEGVDPWGKSFTNRIDVLKGAVQPLWIGIDIPKTVQPGLFTGTITLTSDNAEQRTLSVELNVTSQQLDNRGDDDLWRLSRLRWLNSRAGLDDSKMISPFQPVERTSNTEGAFQFSILNRKVTIGMNGLPLSIRIKGEELLKQPMSMGASFDSMKVESIELVREEAYAVEWSWKGTLSGATVEGNAILEADGYLEYDIAIIAQSDGINGAAALQIPLNRQYSDYLMGFNGDGRMRPDSLRAKWSGPHDSFWIGNAEAGIYCEMQGASYTGPLLNLYHPEYPDCWYNSGKGDYGFSTSGDQVNLSVNSGARSLKKGQQVNYQFAFLITPIKDVDWSSHFDERYFHMTPLKEFTLYDMSKKGKKPTVSEKMLMDNSPMPLDEDIALGINVINIHHAHYENPYINYPFATPERIKNFVDRAHSKDLKVKIYYTVRELSNAAYEIWALRSLGNEIFPSGNGGGYVWLQEHLEKDYIPAWYSHNGEKDPPDAAMVTTGITRWYNYYVEGLRWMTENYGLDGIYLDDVAFDRTILKRMRRVMSGVKPGCLIDLHSNTGFSKGPAIQYTEFFPYLNRLWFGESFDYDRMTAEEMLVEVSGIPFGLTGDMLFRGGNPWRGLLFGMTNRFPWYSEWEISDPRPIYKLFDEISIGTAEMIPWWEDNSPISTGNHQVKATLYHSNGSESLMVALASFAGTNQSIKLSVDWEALGLQSSDYQLFMPEIVNMQNSAELSFASEISIKPAGGAVILMKKR